MPAFGAVKDAWTNFSANCTTCGDSDACQAACATVMAEAPLVVDESRAHPDVCPSFDCPDCVGSCTSCTPAACVRWCDARHAPELRCAGGKATSVQGTFQEYSLQTRTTTVEKAMGNVYDARCKIEGMRREQAYRGAFGPDAGLAFGPGLAPGLAPGLVPGLPSGPGSENMRAYINDRVRRSEERRYKQLEALGVGNSLRRAPALAVPRSVRSVLDPTINGTATLKAAIESAPLPCSIAPMSQNCSAVTIVDQTPQVRGIALATGATGLVPADEQIGHHGGPRTGARGMCPAGTWRPKPRSCHTSQGKTLCTIPKQ